MVDAYLIDIEGTIGDIAFVREVLFPYARARLDDTLKARWSEPEIAKIVGEAAQAAGTAFPTPRAAAEQFARWIDEDKKITPLKTLQGLIWREGYESGALKAHLYPDVIPALDKWRGQGKRLFIYSSGSLEAQRLYFKYSIAGDVTAKFAGFFDTTSGSKLESASYTNIAAKMGVAPAKILFLSDAPAEIAAATAAGLQVRQIDRTKAPDFVGKAGDAVLLGSLQPIA